MNIVTTEEALAEVAQAYPDADAAFGVETVGDARLNERVNQASWLSLASDGRLDVIPMGHPNGEFLHWDKPWLASGKARKATGLELRDKDYSQVQVKWT